MSEIDVDNCKITFYPSQVLAQKAAPVDKIDYTICRFAEKMKDIMVERQGVGLAAPQAGVSLRMFVISVDGSRENAKVYINPTIEPSGEIEQNEEGCLSVPEVYVKIRRNSQCKVTATDLDGNTFTEEGQGLLARALQHEYDHIEGTLIIDRMTPTAKIANRRKLKLLIEDQAQ